MTTDPYLAQPHPGGPMSIEEYLQLDKNAPDAQYEYLDGVAYLMAGPSAEHDQISLNTVYAIREHFQSGPCFVSSSSRQVLIGTKSNGKDHYLHPDATVSCDVADRRRGNTIIRSP